MQGLRQRLGLSVPQRTRPVAIVRLLLERTHFVLIVTLLPRLAFTVGGERGDTSSHISRIADTGLVSLLRCEGDCSPVVGISAGLLVHSHGSII